MSSAVLSWMRDRPGNAWGVLTGVIVAIGLLVACKRDTQDTTRVPEPPVASTSAPNAPDSADAGVSDDSARPVAEGAMSRDPECAAEGQPWNGNPAGCLYEHAGCCYPDPASLCAAAGCSDDDCEIVESHPAQARC